MIGMKCSQQGVDVMRCPDYQLVFSSYFPTLKIYDTYDFYIADTSVAQVICSHNLGYIPAFWVFTDRDTISDISLGYYRLSTSQYLAMNENNLLWRSGAGAGSLGGRVFIFALDISKPYKSDDESSTVKSGNESDDYGVKVIKYSPPIEDKDYSLNSENRYPQIHMVGQGGDDETITHNLGYEPIHFLWADITPDGRYQPVSTADDSVVSATKTTLRYQFTDTINASSYIIFKDPILL